VKEIYRYPEPIGKDGSGKKSACEIKIPPDEVNPIRNSNPATAGLETERGIVTELFEI